VSSCICHVAITELKKYGIIVTSNGILCMTGFVEIGQLVQKLKWTHTHTISYSILILLACMFATSHNMHEQYLQCSCKLVLVISCIYTLCSFYMLCSGHICALFFRAEILMQRNEDEVRFNFSFLMIKILLSLCNSLYSS